MSHPLIVRAAVVATSTAAAALAAVAPTGAAQAAPAPAAVSAAAIPTVVAPVVPLAARPAARMTAMSSALSKLGAPYRWGAAGPSAFDCSGLINWAFRQAGVTLPRTSRSLATVGTPVAKSQLQPGDIVLFYRPISHAAIYIGNGQVVHASTSGQPVKISPMNRMPFAAARRV